MIADELCHTRAVGLGSVDFNAGDIPSIMTLLVIGCCQELISSDKDAFGSRALLIHFTLKEYFSIHQDIFSRPHSAIPLIRLTYLNYHGVNDLTAGPPADFSADFQALSNNYRSPFSNIDSPLSTPWLLLHKHPSSTPATLNKQPLR